MDILVLFDNLASLVLELWDTCVCMIVVLLCALSLGVLLCVFCLLLQLVELIEKWDTAFLDRK